MPQLNDKVYRKFASVYDRLNADLFSVEMAQKTFSLIDRFKIPVKRVLDLCCGTGTAVKIFAEAGYEAEGLDGSRGMLTIARKKLKRHQVKLHHQTLPDFKIPEKRGCRKPKQYDLITSYFDSLNYLLTPRDLGKTFKAVSRHLVTGGYFIFDMNTPHALKYMWNDNVHTDLKANIGIIWRNEYDPKTKTAVCYATFFAKEGKNWVRFDEEHVEAGYSNTEIRGLLREAGMKTRALYDCRTMKKPTRETNRVLVVACKSG
jgi:SAM-dependent methyltransferase